MDLSFIPTDICISWIPLHTPFHINFILFLFSYYFIFRWMQINAKYSFKYALVLWPAPPPQMKVVILVRPRPCLLPRVRLLRSYCRALPFSSASWRLTLCTALLRLWCDLPGKWPCTIQRDWFTFSQSARVDLRNTGVHSNQRWREKILRCKSEEVCVILIGTKKDELFVSLRIWRRRKTFELDCFPTVLCAADSQLQRGHAFQGKINGKRQSQLNKCLNQDSPGVISSSLLSFSTTCYLINLKISPIKWHKSDTVR